jgi:putative ABC transport system permease protein
MAAPEAALAWRELRGAGRHVASLLGGVALGVAALATVGSLGASVERAVSRSGQALLGGDLEIRSSRALSPEVAAVARAEAGPEGRTAMVLELVAMAQHGDAARLVQLKAVGPGYPLYGRLTTDPDGPPGRLLGQRRVLVQPALMERLGLAPGRSVRIGGGSFEVAGLLLGEPDRAASLVTLGPRVLMALEDLPATGLLQPGSHVHHRLLVALSPDRDPAVARASLEARLADPSLRLATYRQAQPGLRRFWEQLTLYLGLAGLVALLVGGLGVAVSVAAFMRARVHTIAVLKCLGAGWRRILALYLTQTLALGLCGSLLGALAGTLAAPLLAPLLDSLLPAGVEWGPSPGAVLRALGMGLGVTLLSALWPLLAIRRVSPAVLLRTPVEPLPARRPWPALLVTAAGLAALALWQAGSWKVGGLFLGGFAGALLGLWALARLTLGLARRVPRPRGLPPAWRQGLAGLGHPGAGALTVLVALGLAVMLTTSVALLEGNLRGEIEAGRAERAPAFFFVDVQPDQAEPFARLVAGRAGAPPRLLPVVRARLAAIREAPPPRPAGDAPAPWYLAREYALTWAAARPPGDRLTAGRWWTAEEARREPLISVEEELARLLGVGLGDRLTFDVQGVPVTARITSLRHVDWRSWDANFFVVFSPGALDGAPATYLATARVPPEGEAALQSAVARAFPNVTAVPVREVLERVAALVDQLALAVRLVATFTVVAGGLVLAGALWVTRAERLYQSVVLRALGATRGFVARAFAVEYAVLGAASGLAGVALAATLAWAAGRWLLDVPWRWQPGPLAGAVALSVGLAVSVGFLGTFRLLGRKPLAVLRGE